LPICFGESTKFSQSLLDADKSYRVTASFGVTTSTQDREGEPLDARAADQLTESEVVAALASFRGAICQVPPMYSAIKVDGTPLYRLAREGKEVERQAREVEIHRLELVEFRSGTNPTAVLEVDCSKGTYVRTLVADLGEVLGVGAHVSALRRTRAGTYELAEAVTLEDLEAEVIDREPEVLDRHLLPEDSPVSAFAEVHLDPQSAEFFIQGQSVIHPQVYRFGAEGDIVRVFVEGGRFLGVAEVSDDARVLPRRLIANH
jgi:tRNA pseudouridine55 synthase